MSRASRRKQDAREYFLAERSIPTWAVAISIVATSLSAATFVGVPDSAYAGDITYLTFTFGGFIAMLVVATLFVPKLYRAGTVTIYGYLAQRFGETARKPQHGYIMMSSSTDLPVCTACRAKSAIWRTN